MIVVTPMESRSPGKDMIVVWFLEVKSFLNRSECIDSKLLFVKFEVTPPFGDL